MIRVIIPTQAEFLEYADECKALYENVQEEIADTNSFEFIIYNTLFYLFLDGKKLIGAIYYFKESDGRLFLNAFANRKMHPLCLEALKMSLNWFKGRIYAEAQNRASALCLLKCGFKRVKENLFMFETTTEAAPQKG